jgi:septal ring factor EnvC (AmiA/AmiB activator)
MPRPVEGVTERKFGKSRHPEYGTVTFNSGIDIRAREGSPIRAIARGRVEYAGGLSGYGNCIIVDHGSGYYSLYARIGDIFVRQGDQVESGDVIAEITAGGNIKAENFHFEIRQSREALDPEKWIR